MAGGIEYLRERWILIVRSDLDVFAEHFSRHFDERWRLESLIDGGVVLADCVGKREGYVVVLEDFQPRLTRSDVFLKEGPEVVEDAALVGDVQCPSSSGIPHSIGSFRCKRMCKVRVSSD